MVEAIFKEKKSMRIRLGEIWSNFGMLIILAIVLTIFFILSPNFRQPVNLIDTFGLGSFVGIGAIGMSLLIMAGEIDISVGSMQNLLGVLTLSLIPKISGIGGLFFIIVVACFLGLINGLIVTKLKVPAFIATLGMLFIYKALAFIYTNFQVSFTDDKFWQFIGQSKIFRIPFSAILLGFFYIVGFLILRKTTIGRYIVAVGSNKNSANLCGINVDNIKILAFILCAFFVAISTVIITSAQASANPGSLGNEYEFRLITAVVLGGTMMGGGMGSIGGTFIASLIIVYFYNGAGMIGIQPYWQNIFMGILLIFSVSMNNLKSTLLGQTKG